MDPRRFGRWVVVGVVAFIALWLAIGLVVAWLNRDLLLLQ